MDKPENGDPLGKVAWSTRDYLEVLHRLCNVEHVHGVDNDGWCGEEKEEDEEADIKEDESHPPRCATDRQILPVRGKHNSDMVWSKNTRPGSPSLAPRSSAPHCPYRPSWQSLL